MPGSLFEELASVFSGQLAIERYARDGLLEAWALSRLVVLKRSIADTIAADKLAPEGYKIFHYHP